MRSSGNQDRGKRIGATLIAALVLASAVAQCSSEPERVPIPAPAAKPYGWIDAPVPGKVTGKSRVYGWALSNQGAVTQIEILLDGRPLKIDLSRVRRDGVCAKYPGRVGCPDVGFEGELDFALVPKGEHSLFLRLTSTGGEVAELAQRTITVE